MLTVTSNNDMVLTSGLGDRPRVNDGKEHLIMSYALKVNPNYFGNENPPHIVRDMDCQIVAVNTKKEAERLVDLLSHHEGPYLCAHGQYAAPSYKVVESKAPERDWYLALAAFDMHYHPHKPRTLTLDEAFAILEDQ